MMELKSKALNEIFDNWETTINKHRKRILERLNSCKMFEEISLMKHCGINRKKTGCGLYFVCPKCQLDRNKKDLTEIKYNLKYNQSKQLSYVTFTSKVINLKEIFNVLDDMMNHWDKMLNSNWFSEIYTGWFRSFSFQKDEYGFWRVSLFITMDYNHDFTERWDNPLNTAMKSFYLFNDGFDTKYTIRSVDTEFIHMSDKLRLLAFNIYPLMWKTITEKMTDDEFKFYINEVKQNKWCTPFGTNYNFGGIFSNDPVNFNSMSDSNMEG